MVIRALDGAQGRRVAFRQQRMEGALIKKAKIALQDG
jgi:hypothetical protein